MHDVGQVAGIVVMLSDGQRHALELSESSRVLFVHRAQRQQRVRKFPHATDSSAINSKGEKPVGHGRILQKYPVSVDEVAHGDRRQAEPASKLAPTLTVIHSDTSRFDYLGTL
eukprot:2972130-Pleurochrysis_carterae.AAC.1